MFSILLDSEEQRNNIIEKLKKNNIPATIYYKHPIYLMKAFEYLGYKKRDFLVSEKLSKRILSLPMHPYLSSQDIKFVLKILES